MDDGRFDDAEEDITRPVNQQQNVVPSKAVSFKFNHNNLVIKNVNR